MMYHRATTTSTDRNLNALLEILDHPSTERLTFFASPLQTLNEPWIYDTSLPLLSCLAQINVPVVGPLFLVFDGNFLTAVRGARYGEVKIALDRAQSSGKAYFSSARLNRFTHTLSPDEAGMYLRQGAFEKLTPDTRAEYFSLLSVMSEEQVQKTLGITPDFKG